MERERQEPRLGAPDLQEMRIRSERSRAIRAVEPATPWAYIAGAVVLAVVIVMGLIEWNARRQAAAITRELMRPATPKEEARLRAEMAKLERDMTAAIDAATPRYQPIPPTVERYQPLPLRDGERCIKGRRFQRIDGGWRDLPEESC